MGTWNCEQQFPEPSQLETLFSHCDTAINHKDCDLVVLALQEASRGGGGRLMLPGFHALDRLEAEGQTKNTENCQLLFVWDKFTPQPNGTVVVANRLSSVVQRDLKKRIKFWSEYGKGSNTTLIEWTPVGEQTAWQLAFTGAHLDSKSAQKRSDQIADAMNAPSTLSQNGRWDVQFMMGDLNFRVNKTGTWTLTHFVSTIYSNPETLFAGDSLKDNEVLRGPWWHFPNPYAGAPGTGTRLQWPSYKKFYKGQQGAQARQVVSITRTTIPQIWDIKVDKDGNVKEGERAGQYDFGWLDRIGYRINGSSSRQVKLLYSGSPERLILSDHAPVYSIYEVT
jgi:hypothetical protein